MSEHSRRRFIKTGALTSGVLTLGLPGLASGQETTTEGDGDADFRRGAMFNDEFYSGAVFRVASPALADSPFTGESGQLGDWSVHVIEYFNTSDENYLFLPPGTSAQEGELYVFDDNTTILADVGIDEDLVRAPFRPLGQDDFPFELDESEDFDILDDGGGEAAIRPGNLYSGALFRITSGPQGWVPSDAAESGIFTEYNTVHAEYLGTNDEFLFFPQEDAEIEQGRLYVMREEFEFFTPAGNLVAAEFDVVNEESVTVDDEFL